jgi:tRNA 5-methylaminomethyl-2-thiouridine biosynthesis bifunctional protein
VSRDVGDVYASEGGLVEKRTVFLEGCGLPEAWRGREAFTVGELGFGSGLSFLALWDLWRRHRPAPEARLHVLSFECALMPVDSAERAHNPWPDVAGIGARLRETWPDRARGVQRLVLPDGVRLTLHIGPIASSLPQAEGQVDAWFLDGFSPAKNPEMWTEEVMTGLAALCAPDARLATYTVAGAVRRALETAGFETSRKPGAGRKRERLEARLGTPPPPPDARPEALLKTATGEPMRTTPVLSKSSRAERPPRRALVIGAGVAGAAMAYALTQRGCETTVIDRGKAPGAGASGNPLALMMPRLDVSDTPEARGLIEAYLFSRRLYLGLGPRAAAPAPTLRRPGASRDRRRFERLLADPPLCARHLQPLNPDAPGDGLRLNGALAIQPAQTLEALLRGASMRMGAEVQMIRCDQGAEVWLSDGARLEGDVLIACTALGLQALLGPACPTLTGRAGQIEACARTTPEAFAEADGGYVVGAFDAMVYGATFEASPDGAAEVTPEGRDVNLQTLERLRPDLLASTVRAPVSRASVRATTSDRLPFIGAINAASSVEGGAGYMIGGLGSHGYLWAPFLAEALASRLFGEPAPAERCVLERLSPARLMREPPVRRQRDNMPAGDD